MWTLFGNIAQGINKKEAKTIHMTTPAKHAITPTNAEGFCRKVLAKQQYLVLHSQLLWHCCQLLAEGKKVDLEAMQVAAWLHDTGRAYVTDGHAEKSVELAEEQFGTLNPVVKDCIANHGADNNPTTEEGRIFQLADKISLLTPESFLADAREDKRKAMKRWRKHLDKIEKVLEGYEF